MKSQMEVSTQSTIDYVRCKNFPVVTFDSYAPQSRRNDFVGANNFDVHTKDNFRTESY